MPRRSAGAVRRSGSWRALVAFGDRAGDRRPARARAEGAAVVLVRDVAARARRLRRRCSSAPGIAVRRLRHADRRARRRATDETLVVLDPGRDGARGGAGDRRVGARRRPARGGRQRRRVVARRGARRPAGAGSPATAGARRTLVPVAETAGVQRGALADGGGWHELGGALPVIGPAGRAAAWSPRAAGEGSVALLADASPLQNAALGARRRRGARARAGGRRGAPGRVPGDRARLRRLARLRRRCPRSVKWTLLGLALTALVARLGRGPPLRPARGPGHRARRRRGWTTSTRSPPRSCGRNRKEERRREGAARPRRGRGAQGRRRPATRRSRTCSPRSRSAATCCSRASPAWPRRCWRARPPARSAIEFRRLQFTPDMLPSDVTGHDGAARRRARLPPRPGVRRRRARRRDQPHAAEDPGRAAGGDAGGPGDRRRRQSHPLPDPFLVLATQNPVEYEGTYPLPEAQRDRFLVHVAIGYPSADEERAMLRLARRGLAPTALDDVAAGRERRGPARRARRGRRDRGLRRGRRLRRRDRPPHARAARASRSAPARAPPSTCSAPPRPPRGSPAAPTSRPTTSPAWPPRCCATGSSSRPRPSSSARRRAARSAPRSRTSRCRDEPDARAARGRRPRGRSRSPALLVLPLGARRCSAGRARSSVARRSWTRGAATACAVEVDRRRSRGALARRPGAADGRGARARRRHGARPPGRAARRSTIEPREGDGDARRDARRRAAAAGTRCPPSRPARPGRSGSPAGTTGRRGPPSCASSPTCTTARRLALAVARGRFRDQGATARGPLGLGTEFELIRDYQPDDDIRQVNWRATARLGRPMSNQYRLEQDRDLLLLIDAGPALAPRRSASTA